MNKSTDHVGGTPPDDTRDKFETEQYEVLGCFSHDDKAFTEGLEFYDGFLYESTGLCYLSGVRRVELRTGRVLQEVLLERVCKGEDCIGTKSCFAEGLTILKGKVFQLTWRSQKGFVYDAKSLQKLSEFNYKGEGWGLTHDGQFLIMSNGSNQIQFLDPVTFKVAKTIRVTNGNQPLTDLNELEYVNGEIYANMFNEQYGEHLARIDPRSGNVSIVIDLTKLCEPYRENGVLNGIVYDEEHDRFFITGKNWPKLFEIRLK
jgi:glutamine cyclotransferase